MTLGEIIGVLERCDPDRYVKIGVTRPHSYRGYYYQLAFHPHYDQTVRDMLNECKDAIGKTFQGYKGGCYTMGKDTPVWLASYGCCGEEVGPILLSLMLGVEEE